MRQQVYVVHYHEIALKGRNRPMFLSRLQENICRATGLSKKEVKIVSGRLLVFLSRHPERSAAREVEGSLHHDIASATHEHAEEISPLASRLGRNDEIENALGRVFGISSFSPAVLVKADYEEIEMMVGDIVRNPLQLPLNLRGRENWTFAIVTTRGDKKFAMTSQEMNVKLGSFVSEKFGKKVNLTNPDVTFYVEVFSAKGGSASGGEDGALIYRQRIAGAGGLPTGSQSKVAVMLSGGIDSPVAAYRVMKRGAPIIGVHCHSYPFTSRASIDKVKELAGLLSKYGGGMKLYLVPLADAQKAVVQNCEEKYRVLLYRRLMVRIAQALAVKEGAQMLVTGEALGQVASQTVENICVTDAVATIPILRPLIGYDKEEIIMEARRIGTYDVSILPHDDCCTLMMPKNPATRARLSDVEREEKKIDVQRLVTDAIARCEIATSPHGSSQ